MNLIQMRTYAAQAALQYIQDNQIIGIGTGKTINIFIEQLATIKHKISGAVASSTATQNALKSFGIPLIEFNAIDELPIYVDSADAYNSLRQLIKGAGGALTREKILAYAAKKFICIVDATKKPDLLGKTPVAVEVIPMARSFVARNLVKLGGQPQYRDNFVTDNGNIILDVHNLQINQPINLEEKINQIPGVVENGIFAARTADVILVGNRDSTQTL